MSDESLAESAAADAAKAYASTDAVANARAHAAAKAAAIAYFKSVEGVLGRVAAGLRNAYPNDPNTVSAGIAAATLREYDEVTKAAADAYRAALDASGTVPPRNLNLDVPRPKKAQLTAGSLINTNEKLPPGKSRCPQCEEIHDVQSDRMPDRIITEEEEREKAPLSNFYKGIGMEMSVVCVRCPRCGTTYEIIRGEAQEDHSTVSEQSAKMEKKWWQFWK